MSLRQTVADAAIVSELAHSLGAEDILEAADDILSPVNIVLINILSNSIQESNAFVEIFKLR